RARRKILPGFRRAGLRDNRIPLRRPRDVERAAYREELALVVEDVQFRMVEVLAGFLVAQEGFVAPRVPQTHHYIGEFLGPAVALGMRLVFFPAEIHRLHFAPAGDDVPADTAAAEVIERGEFARDRKGVAVGG